MKTNEYTIQLLNQCAIVVKFVSTGTTVYGKYLAFRLLCSMDTVLICLDMILGTASSKQPTQRWAHFISRSKDQVLNCILTFKENRLLIYIYSVTQAYSNSVLGDVVLDSFKNASRDKYKIGVALKPNLWGLSCRKLYFFKYAFSSITPKILNSHNKRLKIFAFHIFGLKCCLHP